MSAAQVVSALGGAHDLAVCTDWDGLWSELRSRPVDGCVVDVYCPDRPAGMRELQRLRKRRPTLAVVVFSDFRGREMDLFTLGRLKVDGVILAGRNQGVGTTRAAVEEALSTSVATRVVDAMEGRLPALAIRCLRWSIERAHEAPRPRDLAEALSISHRTLPKQLRRAGLPSPRRLLLWGRLFRAAHYLAEPGACLEQVAYSLGYSSGNTLTRALRRETGHPASELRKRGGLVLVLEAFLRRESRSRSVRARRSWRLPPRQGPRALGRARF